MVRRLLAAVFAVVVLFVAFQLRSDRETGGGFGGRGGGRADGTAGDNGYEVFEDDEVALLCIEDLREICEGDLDLLRFAVKIEPAWTTVQRLRDGDELGADVWLTVHPFPELARPPARGGGATSSPSAPATLAAPTSVLARSPVVVAGSNEAVAALGERCPEAATLFSCLGADPASNRVVVRDPTTSAIGSLSATAVVHELGLDAAAFAADPAAPERLAALARAARRSQAPLEDSLRIGGFTVAITLEAEVLDLVGESDFDEREAELQLFGLRYPLDVRAVELVAVPTPQFGRPKDLQTALLSRAAGFGFERHGWIAEGRDPYLLETAMFEDRPAMRTDLPWDAELVRAVREVVAR